MTGRTTRGEIKTSPEIMSEIHRVSRLRSEMWKRLNGRAGEGASEIQQLAIDASTLRLRRLWDAYRRARARERKVAWLRQRGKLNVR